MNRVFAVDREGRRWVLLRVDGTLRARLDEGHCTPAVMEVAGLAETFGPLVLSSSTSPLVGVSPAFVDTVDLVAADPETASIVQIDAVARFTRAIIDCSHECHAFQDGTAGGNLRGRQGAVDISSHAGCLAWSTASAASAVGVRLAACSRTDPEWRRGALLNVGCIPSRRLSGQPEVHRPDRQISTDGRGGHGPLVATEGTVSVCHACGSSALPELDVSTLVDLYGTVVLSPASLRLNAGYHEFVALIDLVAADPETATVEQLTRVATFARALVAGASG
ncbi:hypothetical protein [Prescottella agglutinans]|uniref:Uncharacterized protein n=1 Tax=Prescottella agglutinans TaxID=1644129 RepID=A0ABT6MK18_9NOCA|nr:hypothetical protein [Prescottella agglutinans]MDH6284560.1 hypothetical protein [Prescottella agglutinans]